MALPKIYQVFYKEKIFNFSEVIEKFREDEYSEGYLRKRLNDLLRAGYLGSVGARGLYYIIPQGSIRQARRLSYGFTSFLLYYTIY